MAYNFIDITTHIIKIDDMEYIPINSGSLPLDKAEKWFEYYIATIKKTYDNEDFYKKVKLVSGEKMISLGFSQSTILLILPMSGEDIIFFIDCVAGTSRKLNAERIKKSWIELIQWCEDNNIPPYGQWNEKHKVLFKTSYGLNYKEIPHTFTGEING